MKVTRRRQLFYQPRRSNLYRIFALVLVILVVAWFAAHLKSGSVRNPFDPTPTPTRTSSSWAEEGDADFDAGDLKAAITAYNQATLTNSLDAGAWAKLARIQAYSSRLLTNDTQRLARLEQARQSIDRAVALAPDDSDVHAYRAFVLDWSADPALDPLRASGSPKAADLLLQAEQEAVVAQSLNNQNALALAYYAEILTDEQKWTQAEQVIQQALLIDPNIMDVHRAYGYVLESIGSYNQAIQEYQKALAINPNLTFLYISVGTNYRTLAKNSTIDTETSQLYQQALDNFVKAVNINTANKDQDPTPYIAIAKTYSQEGEFFIAAQNALQAIAFDPTNADLYGQLGIIYQKGRNYESAIYALQCAVLGCDPAVDKNVNCQARYARDCAVGDDSVKVNGLALSPNTEFYYAAYGSVLAALSPNHPEYCTHAVTVLTELQAQYGSDPTISAIAKDGLDICSGVLARLAETPTPAYTPTPVPTPRFTPALRTPPTPFFYPTWTP